MGRSPTSRRAGFTLIELLVVISIIALLISLLLPALSQSRYVTNLVVCATALKHNGVGVFTYATDNDEFYPERWLIAADGNTATPSLLRGAGAGNDLRPLLGAYLPLNDSFLCSFAGPIDLTREGSKLEVHSSYDMWFGWYPKGQEGEVAPGWEQRMARLNDDFVFSGTAFDVLMNDSARQRFGTFVSVHPVHGAARVDMEAPDSCTNGISCPVLSAYVGYVPTSGFDPGNQNFMFTDGHAETIAGVVENDPRFETVVLHRGQMTTQMPPKD